MTAVNARERRRIRREAAREWAGWWYVPGLAICIGPCKRRESATLPLVGSLCPDCRRELAWTMRQGATL